MTRPFIILTIIFLLSSCKFGKQTDKVKFASNGDTLEVIKCYPSDRTKEIIYYNNNKPTGNIGFNPDGDTIKFPNAFYSGQDNKVFIFIPIKLNICNYEIIFAVDSATHSDQKKWISLINLLTALLILPELSIQKNQWT